MFYKFDENIFNQEDEQRDIEYVNYYLRKEYNDIQNYYIKGL